MGGVLGGWRLVHHGVVRSPRLPALWERRAIKLGSSVANLLSRANKLAEVL